MIPAIFLLLICIALLLLVQTMTHATGIFVLRLIAIGFLVLAFFSFPWTASMDIGSTP